MSDTRDGAQEPIPEMIDTMVRDFCAVGPRPKSEVRRRLIGLYDAGSSQVAALQTEIAGLRKRIHHNEQHNQYFFRCESAWCNPDESNNPALEMVKGAVERAEKAESQVAALQEVAGRYEEKMSCGHPRRYLTTSTPNASDLICAECKRSALARRNEQLEAALQKYYDTHNGGTEWNNVTCECSTCVHIRREALLEKRTQL
jgi:hypothetical protein